MSTFRRRVLVTAALPAAAFGFLLAAPGAASAAPAPTQPATSSPGTWHDHHHHGIGLNLRLLLGLQIIGGWHDGDCDWDDMALHNG
ncbi:hypothetical protein [Amycolatopsis samaneae]|uniref:Secreted protein n=1 Tax=Amycolatopsis samaneae TaxID=664691 RepID=A0ABW5GK98_9PSEU